MVGKKHTLVSVAVIVLGFIGVYFLSSHLEANRINLPESYADEDLSLQAKRLKGFALGTEGLLSDWYWMNALQYIGRKFLKEGNGKINLDDLRPLNPRLLYPMLDIATELDSRSMAPFSFGATMLPVIDTDQAIALTEKGIARNPDNWRLRQYLGFIYWKTKNYARAAEVYDEGARIPGAPPFFKLMAAKIRTESGSRDVAREIYKQSIAEAPDESTRNAGEMRLKELDSLDEREAIDRVLSQLRQTTGRCPANLRETIPGLRGITLPDGNEFEVDGSGQLVDPTGVPYLLDSESCTASIDFSRSRIPSK